MATVNRLIGAVDWARAN